MTYQATELEQANAPQRVATLAKRSLRMLRPLILALPLVLVACAAKDAPVEQRFDANTAGRLFSAGYQGIAEIYIESVPLSELAVAGLDSLATIDPDFEVERQGNRVRLSAAGQPDRQLDLPWGRDAEDWGSFTAASVGAAQGLSPKLKAAKPEALYEAVFDGMLSQLDGYSRYAGREEASEHRANRDGFGGIGVRIRMGETGVEVLSVMDQTPAQSAGLLAGDLITAIDAETVFGLSQQDIVHRLRGPSYSKVVLTVRRKDAVDPLSISVTRSHIVPQTVSYEARGNVALFRITSFNQDTTRSLREKMEQAQAELGSRMAGMILDLRGNPGGLLDQAVGVSDVLMSHGRIVSTHGRHLESHQFFEAHSDELAASAPVVVLVDGGSASAAEIVAAALQDSGRAVLVGTNSFGKGTVQTVMRLPNEGEMTLTWARFHAPTGYTIDHRGVLPDVCTSAGDATVERMIENLQRGQAAINRIERTRLIDLGDEPALTAFRDRCPAHVNEQRDLEVEVAQRLLADPSLFARALGTIDSASKPSSWTPAQVSTGR
ncbi:MAG: S41 family peptidase [Kiloniellales bacterium]